MFTYEQTVRSRTPESGGPSLAVLSRELVAVALAIACFFACHSERSGGICCSQKRRVPHPFWSCRKGGLPYRLLRLQLQLPLPLLRFCICICILVVILRRRRRICFCRCPCSFGLAFRSEAKQSAVVFVLGITSGDHPAREGKYPLPQSPLPLVHSIRTTNTQTQSNFQSTTPLLTPTVNLTQTPTSPAEAGLHHLTHYFYH